MVKMIPNILSALRIICAAILALAFQNTLLFVICYCTAGVTDVLDGFLARKLGAESELGAKLDSFADLCLYGVGIWFFVRAVKGYTGGDVLLGLVYRIILIRFVNLGTARIRFGHWFMAHTVLNKLSGLLSFAGILLLALVEVPIFIIYVVLGVCLLSGLEEFLILVLKKDYNLNRKGIWDT